MNLELEKWDGVEPEHSATARSRGFITIFGVSLALGILVFALFKCYTSN